MVVVARLGAMKDIHKIHINAGRASSFLKGLANENRLVIICALAEGKETSATWKMFSASGSRPFLSNWRDFAAMAWSQRGVIKSKFITA